MEDSAVSRSITKGAPFPKQHRAKYSRSTSGCLSCRRRRKKCDEQHPVCSGCSRNQLRCDWPTSSNEDRTAQDASKDNVRSRSVSTLSFCLLRSLPIAAPAGFRSILSLTKSSNSLFQHYFEHTSTLLTVLSNDDNPFKTHVIEVAMTDSLLLHTIIAVSGVHLNFNDEAALEVRQATSLHYTTALNGVRKELDTALPLSQVTCFRLALILVLVAHVEVIIAEPTGDVFPHLRAVHQLLEIADKQSPSELSQADNKSKGLALETYAYLSICSHITPYGLLPARTLPLDKFVTDLNPLRQYSTYGSFFSCGHDIFDFIPQIAVLARECLYEILKSGCPSPKSKRIETRLRGQLKALLAENSVFKGAALAARQIFGHALSLFLETAMCGSSIDICKLEPILQPHVDAIMFTAPLISRSNFGAIMLWPLVIWASCCIRKVDRDTIRILLERPQRYRVNQVVAAGHLIRLMWESDDPCAFGPYGLYLMMEEHGINLSMA